MRPRLLLAAIPTIVATMLLVGAAQAPGGTASARGARPMREPVGEAFPINVRWPIDLIHLPAAWDVSTGSTPGPLIAVIDTGVVTTSDLVGRVSSETFVGGAPGTDPYGHGTQVAGIIAGSGSDGVGLAGVCWTCRILSLQVSANGSINDDDVVVAINRAVERGADVINLSFGYEIHANAERAAIARAVAAGIVVVASAGNDALLVPQFPAAYTGVVAVGAAGSNGFIADFSNHGSWVGVLAPACGAALDPNNSVDSRFCGTSASAPFVAGLAGLLLSVAPRARAADVVAAIQRSAHRREGSAHGLIDAAAALALIRTIKPGSSGPTKGALVHVVKRPMILGVGRVNARLAGSPGAWSGPLISIHLGWERCTRLGKRCKPVGNGQSYRVRRVDRGHGIRLVVHAVGEDNVGVDAPSRLLVIR